MNKFTFDEDAVENTANEAQHSTASHKGSMVLAMTGCLMQDCLIPMETFIVEKKYII